MTPPLIREPRAADLPDLDRIHRDVRAEIRSRPTRGFARDTEGERVLVAEMDGRVVGFVAIFVTGDFVHHLYVDRPYRGRGVGAALLAAATAGTPRTPWLKVEAHNTAARGFYAHLGWVAIGEKAGIVSVRGPEAGPDQRAITSSSIT